MHLKVPPLLLTVIFAALMFAESRLMPTISIAPPMKNVSAILIAIAGTLICILGVATFQRARTTVDPTRPEQTSSLVVSGIYRVSRNPMYLGFLLLLMAWSVYLGQLLSLFLGPMIFIVYMNRFQIVPEEQALELLFGDVFITYKKSVRRWI
jgi:protein-S-isoprenylcysteine O-methyltransferase Ste14